MLVPWRDVRFARSRFGLIASLVTVVDGHIRGAREREPEEALHS